MAGNSHSTGPLGNKSHIPSGHHPASWAQRRASEGCGEPGGKPEQRRGSRHPTEEAGPSRWALGVTRSARAAWFADL